jgi:hypothetical protein
MSKVKSHNGYYGCLECHEKSTDVHKRVEQVSIHSVPWKPRTQDSYLEELRTHLVAVQIDDTSAHRRLVASLAWHDAYPWGRHVVGNKGSEWGLAAQDQLIVSYAIRNPHDLESLAPPFKVFFFRHRKESGISGVSIMFNIPGVHSFGIEHFEVVNFCECTLHTLDLGASQRFCATAMTQALLCNIFKLPYRGKTQLVKRGSPYLGKAIKKYYKREHKATPWKKLSTLSKCFTWRDLGGIKKPCLKAKGGETRGLVKFCTELMQKHKCKQKGQLLARSGEALMDFYAVMEEESRCMSFKAKRRLVSAAVNHVSFYKAAGGHLVHKHHGLIHMALSAGRIGNPRCVSTYEDEHENGVVARIGLHVHGSTFAKSVFERLELQNPERRVRDALP